MRVAAPLAVLCSSVAFAQPADVAKPAGEAASIFVRESAPNRSLIGGTRDKRPFSFLPAEQASAPAVAVDSKLSAPAAAPKVVRGADGSLKIVQ